MSEMTVRRSDEINELAAALAKAQGDFGVVEKKRTARVSGKTREGNPYNYTFNYADLGDVLSMALPVLSKHGIAFTQPTVVEAGVIYIRTTLMHTSGQWQESDYPVANFGDKRHQQIGEALTFGKRYSGCAVLGIAPEETLEDTDIGGDAEIGSPERQRAPRPKAEVVQGNDGKSLPPVVGEPYVAADGKEVPPDKSLREHYKEQSEEKDPPKKQITLLRAQDGSETHFDANKKGAIAAFQTLDVFLEESPDNWTANREVVMRLLTTVPDLSIGTMTVKEKVDELVTIHEGIVP